MDYKKAGCRPKAQKVRKYAEGGLVEPYPGADDNLFFASGPDEKIIRAKRNIRSRMQQDDRTRTKDWPGINAYMDRAKTREIADEVRGRKRSSFDREDD